MIMRSLILLLALLLVGCDGDAPRAGTAQHASVEAAAHASASRAAADAAAVDAAAKDARAAELAAWAERLPTAERIAAAADARVEAASARAVSKALAGVADESAKRARDAQSQAGAERQREAKEGAEAAWLFWCRAIALGCLLAGAVLGALIGYATREPRTGLWIGGGLAAVGLVVLAFGQSLPWLAWLVPVGGVIALAVWAVKNRTIDNARTLLAQGYQRTSAALSALDPSARDLLDAQSLDEQRRAGVLDTNNRVFARLPAPSDSDDAHREHG